MGTYRTDTLEVVGKKYFNTGGAQKMYSKESVPIISERPFQTRGAVFGYRKNFYDSPSQEEVGESRLGRKSRGSETKFLEMD